MSIEAQTAAIRQSIQTEQHAKDAKDELVRELVEALKEARESVAYWSRCAYGRQEKQDRIDDLTKIDAVLRKAGAYNV